MRRQKINFEVIPLSQVPGLAAQDGLAAAAVGPRRRTILNVSYNRPVATTRAMVLTQAGYDVSLAFAIGEALKLSAAKPFDLFIIGHSIPLGERHALAKSLRKSSSAPILALRMVGEQLLPGVQNHLFSQSGPEALIEIVGNMLHE